MKICIINNLYQPFARGGAEKIAELSAWELKNSGHDVFVIATKPVFKKTEAFSPGYKIYYINSIFYYLDKIPLILRLFWHFFDFFDIGAYIRVKSILKKEKPDLALTHNLKGLGSLIFLAIARLKIKHIHTLHDIQLFHPSGLLIYGQENKLSTIWTKIYIALNRFFTKKVNKVISPSKWLLAQHLSRGFFASSKRIVEPNPIPRIRKTNKQPVKNYPKEINLLYVGHINRAKGVLFLAKALKKSKIPYRLTLAGNATDNKIKKEIGQNHNIEIRGYLDREKIGQLMEQSDLLAVPSLCYENSPTVIYEAAARGLPVIAPRIGGITELVRSLGGILFAPGSEQDFLKKLTWAGKHRRLLDEIGIKSSDIIKKYSPKGYIEKLLDLAE